MVFQKEKKRIFPLFKGETAEYNRPEHPVGSRAFQKGEAAMKSLTPKYPHMLHGGDYNPDQWLDRPDILEEDIRLMKHYNMFVMV